MRARELFENYNQSLESDLNNLLVGAKGNDVQQVRTQDVVDQLYSMGYSVDINSIMTILSDNPIVMNATPQMINLTAPESSASTETSAGEDSALKVSDMAAKATRIG